MRPRLPLAPVGLLLSALLVSPALSQQAPGGGKPLDGAADETGARSPLTPNEHNANTLGRVIKGQALLDDLEQFRSLLKRDWILSNLNDADFDAAIEVIARDAPAGMTLADLTLRLQRVLALGCDGHAAAGQFNGAMQTVPGPRPDFVIDVSGEGYTAYRIEHAVGGRVNPSLEHRFVPLKEGYPHLLAIDGKPIAEWVRATLPYICKGPASAVRWRAMRILHELPFVRRELHLPDAPTIRVRLASSDGQAEVEIDTPTNPYRRPHPAVPRPDWQVLEGNIGHLWIKDPASGGAEAIIRGMPELRDTRGLIIDLRDNPGGAGLDTLQLICDYLLPADRPRLAAGRLIHWRGDRWSSNTGEVSAETEGLSDEGRRFLAAFERRFEPKWRPPDGRATEPRTVFLARADAEPTLFPYNIDRWPKSSHYSAPVVVLFNHRCFSAAEIFLASIREVPGVTLVGTAATSGGGGRPEFHRLRRSGLDVILTDCVFVRHDGTLIDGQGIVPDVVAEPDAEDYLGRRDRMLEKAVEVLNEKIDTGK